MKKVLLSFDIEEFDLPREHGVNIPFKDSMAVSIYGTNKILELLRRYQIKATFFVTGVFAQNAKDILNIMRKEGHEIACHGVDHYTPQKTDVAVSKQIVEKIAGVKVYGYRQPRMFPVSDEEIKEVGFLYNSSLNPAFIPGRYMHLDIPRTPFVKDGLLQIPASVTPIVRFPLFWLSNHVLPMWLYHWMIRRTLHHDGYFTTYMHPWEFYPLDKHPEWKIQPIIKMNCGNVLLSRLESLILMLKKENVSFMTYHEFIIETGSQLEG